MAPPAEPAAVCPTVVCCACCAAPAVLRRYVKYSMGHIENFDPFAILQVPVDATEAEIKKAYRKLSLQVCVCACL